MAKASFEESLENFLKAGVNGEKENANGVSASIMLGKMPNIGTGVFDLIVDIQKLIDNAPIEKEERKENHIKNEKNDIATLNGARGVDIVQEVVKKKGFVRNQTPIF